jgi:CRISPR/Cas system-associated exonuclease Cas4 (RecB family)
MLISPTMLNTFIECPYKYYLAYVEYLKPQWKPAYEIGKNLHTIIENYYKELTDSITPSEVSLYVSSVVKRLNLDPELYKTYLNNFVKIEQQRLSWHINPKPLAIEQEYIRPPFRGVIDAMFMKGNDKVIIDWKTGFHKPNPIRDKQLMVQGNIYLYITGAKEVYFAFLSYGNIEKVMYDEDELKPVLRDFFTSIKTYDYPRMIGENCKNCEYNIPCFMRMWNVRWSDI